jgi:GNAT superfamily N-acetyltransferase
MNLIFETIDNTTRLGRHKDAILTLFKESFGRDLDDKIWEWAYMDNPIGQPIVSLCINDEHKLIGHYAVIPIPLIRRNKAIMGCLSLSTMVHANYRRYGIFSQQAEQVNERARAIGCQLVYGFPNINSAPGFQKRLSWTLPVKDYVACLTMEELTACKSYISYLQDDSLVALDMNNMRFKKWRLSKPFTKYTDKGSTIFKEFSPHDDIVYMNSDVDKTLNKTTKFNILIDAKIHELQRYKIFDYQFGYRVFDDTVTDLQFKKDLLMSDVF